MKHSQNFFLVAAALFAFGISESKADGSIVASPKEIEIGNCKLETPYYMGSLHDDYGCEIWVKKQRVGTSTISGDRILKLRDELRLMAVKGLSAQIRFTDFSVDLEEAKSTPKPKASSRDQVIADLNAKLSACQSEKAKLVRIIDGAPAAKTNKKRH